MKMAAVVVILTATVLGQMGDARPDLQIQINSEQKAWAQDLHLKAEQGDAEAQFNLSQAYQDGYVFKQNWTESVKWLRASAEQGNPKAEGNLGALYFLGTGVPRDLSKALVWTQKAAGQGDVKGEYNLGYMYASGVGVPKNDGQAVHWYRKAAEQGHQVAAYDVGLAYSYGTGIAQDQVKGYKWLLLAWRFGWAPSKKALDTVGATLDPAKIRMAQTEAAEWIKVHPNVKPIQQ